MTKPAAVPLDLQSYARDTVEVARALLGCVLHSSNGGVVTAGRIVEVEAYVGPHDPAAHGYGNRRTHRNDALFGPPGTAYVFRSYGIHWCFNAVTERDDYPSAVLIRALEPIEGVTEMKLRRSTEDERRLCAGPGRLTQALAITDASNGVRLDRGKVRILGPSATTPPVCRGPRVGISHARDWPLRFYLEGPWHSR
ncbi:MAG: DNA-3-methyladenine glycosylase [Gemmatimonadota bacterium]|nr:DNA-3-methyladenine glycosylase [Gemmatimonadota bacterium]